jgi:hypothetical protein
MQKHKPFAQSIINRAREEWLRHPVISIVSMDGKTFDPNGALKAYRYQIKSGRRDPKWVEMTRIWQIKNKLNYGRY